MLTMKTKISKLTSIIMMVIIMALLNGCTLLYLFDTHDDMRRSLVERRYNISSDVSLSVVGTPFVEFSPEVLEVVFTNTSEYRYISGYFICVDKNINGTWYRLPDRLDGHISLGIDVPPNADTKYRFGILGFHEHITIGNYRLVVRVARVRDDGSVILGLREQVAIAEFQVE